MTALWPVLFLTFSTGCAERPKDRIELVEVVRVEKPSVKPADLRCPPEPKAPFALSQSVVAAYILELVGWGRSCESKLDVVRQTLEN